MNNIEAIRVLECIATDITGALMDANMTSSKQTALMQKLDAIDLAQKVLRDVSAQDWISVDDELPPKYEDVFAYDSKEKRVALDFINHSNNFVVFGSVTHWMPFPYPLPPKEDNHG
jgi:hypothetical protein